MTEAEQKYEALLERMKELKADLIALGGEVHDDRKANVTSTAAERVDSALALAGRNTVSKGAMAVKAHAEAQLEELAKTMQEPKETFAKAYVRAMESELGKSMLATLEDATRLAQGQPTESMLAVHRKSLGA